MAEKGDKKQYKSLLQIFIFFIVTLFFCKKKGKDTCFIPPEGGRAAEAFQSLFSHTDGKIRDGYGEDGYGRKVVGY
jgi:hypothetical protein